MCYILRVDSARDLRRRRTASSARVGPRAGDAEDPMVANVDVAHDLAQLETSPLQRCFWMTNGHQD